MDSVVCNKVQPVVRKVKKKQVKGEIDRLKQAEKKKRRLEKALATSAAIRSELEKKKQSKKEEQQRLDEEGAAIAEAVALQVLLGEDSDDSCKILLNEEEGFKHWGCAGKLDLFTDNSTPCLSHEDGSRYKLERIGWVSDPYETGFRCGEVGNSDWPFSCGSLGRDMHTPYFAGEVWGTTNFSAGLIAAQAVSSLQIAEDAPVDTIVINGMLRR